MLGEFSEPKLADDEIKLIVSKVRQSTEMKLNNGSSFNEFEAISYQTKIVSGTLYLVRTRCDIGLINLLIFKTLQGQITLNNIDITL